MAVNYYRLKELIHNHELMMDMMEVLIEQVEQLNISCEEISESIKDIHRDYENEIKFYAEIAG